MSAPLDHPLRWRMWCLWWITHSLVGGTGRVIFDLSFPFIEAPDAISGLLAIGTAATILGKVVSGPLCSTLGAFKIGLAALFGSAILLVGVGLGSSSPLLPLTLAWPLFRCLQTITWPSANSVCVAWFRTPEHGAAWGMMSTASRTGIILATSVVTISALDLSSRACFLSTGCAMAIFGLVMANAFRAHPPPRAAPSTSGSSSPDSMLGGAATSVGSAATGSTAASGGGGSLQAQVKVAARNPILWLAVLSQATATPIAEFQSVLPLLLKADATLDSSAVAAGVTCWHLGILVSVIACGMLLDRMQTMGQRLLLVPLTAVTAALFFSAAAAGTGADSPLFAGSAKLPLGFALGASAAPAIYLVAATTVTRHASGTLAPTLSSICDMAGYSGTVLVLLVGAGDEGVAGPRMLRAIGACACCNIGFVSVLYLLEARQERRRGSVKVDGLADPLLVQSAHAYVGMRASG